MQGWREPQDETSKMAAPRLYLQMIQQFYVAAKKNMPVRTSASCKQQHMALLLKWILMELFGLSIADQNA